jgi:hypothetical protein
MADNPFAHTTFNDPKEPLEPVAPTVKPEVKPEVPASKPEVLVVKEFVPFRLSLQQIDELKLILKNSGADSASQITAFERIKNLVEG